MNIACTDVQMNHRCDLALYMALYEQALIQAGRLKIHRDVLVKEFGEFATSAAGRAIDMDWEELSRGYNNIIVTVDRMPRSFAISIHLGDYDDDAMGIRYEIRAGRGVWARGEGGWDEPVTRQIQSPSRVDGAVAVARSQIRHAISQLQQFLWPIPRPSDYQPPPEYQETERERRDREMEELAYKIRQDRARAERRQERSPSPRPKKIRLNLFG